MIAPTRSSASQWPRDARRKLRLGTSVQVLPGRNPVLLAKEWASLDRLSNGRTLPAFGLGVADPREQQAFGVARGDRARWFDEALPLIRASGRKSPSTTTASASTSKRSPWGPSRSNSLGCVARRARASRLRRIGLGPTGRLPSFPSRDASGPARSSRTRPQPRAARSMTNTGGARRVSDGPVPDLVTAALAARRPRPRRPERRDRSRHLTVEDADRALRGCRCLEIRRRAAGRARRLGRRTGPRGRRPPSRSNAA